jgi:hypothetical protein
MGLKNTIQKITKSVIEKSLGDLSTLATYHSLGVKTVSLVTGDITEVGGTDEPNVSMVFAKYSDFEIANTSVIKTDRKLLISNLSLTATPKKNDYIVTSNVTWKILDVEIDPADAVWILQSRVKAT